MAVQGIYHSGVSGVKVFYYGGTNIAAAHSCSVVVQGKQ